MSAEPADQPWVPDTQLVAAVLAGSRQTLADLADLDRCWLVAGLTARGLTAEDIAERLKCARRSINTIRARTETKAFAYAATETAAFTGELQLRDGAIAALKTELVEAVAARDRYREQRDNLIDAQIVGMPVCAKCSTPFDRGNTYWREDHHGRKRRCCRNCNRIRQQRYRDRQREGGESEVAFAEGGPVELALADVIAISSMERPGVSTVGPRRPVVSGTGSGCRGDGGSRPRT